MSTFELAPGITLEPQGWAARLGAALREARVRHEVTLRQLARDSGGRFGMLDLLTFERGRRAAGPTLSQLLAELYQIDLEAIAPPRSGLEVDLSGGTLCAGGATRRLSETDDLTEETLTAYLDLVMALRGACSKSIALRRDDMETLAAALALDEDAVVAALSELMECSGEEARRLLAVLRRKSLLVPVTMTLSLGIALAAAHTVGVAGSASPSRVAAPARVTSALPSVAGIALHTAAHATMANTDSLPRRDSTPGLQTPLRITIGPGTTAPAVTLVALHGGIGPASSPGPTAPSGPFAGGSGTPPSGPTESSVAGPSDTSNRHDDVQAVPYPTAGHQNGGDEDTAAGISTDPGAPDSNQPATGTEAAAGAAGGTGTVDSPTGARDAAASSGSGSGAGDTSGEMGAGGTSGNGDGPGSGVGGSGTQGDGGDASSGGTGSGADTTAGGTADTGSGAGESSSGDASGAGGSTSTGSGDTGSEAGSSGSPSVGAAITGTNKADTITGTAGNDTIRTRGGDDQITGEAGNDRIDGGSGNDTVHGGDGNDRITGGSGDDSLSGEAGNDNINGGAGDDVISGGDGNDVLKGGTGNDIIDGGTGNNRIDGGSGNDTVHGGDGNDRITGAAGDDILYGNAGNDRISGGDGDDVLAGGDGNDVIDGGAGTDLISGGDGNDRITLGKDGGTAYGGKGNDTFVLTKGAKDVAFGGEGKDRVVGEIEDWDEIDLDGPNEPADSTTPTSPS